MASSRAAILYMAGLNFANGLTVVAVGQFQRDCGYCSRPSTSASETDSMVLRMVRGAVHAHRTENLATMSANCGLAVVQRDTWAARPGASSSISGWIFKVFFAQRVEGDDLCPRGR